MRRSNLYDYRDGYIHVKGTITVPNTTAAGVAVNNTNKLVIFKNCASFTDCLTEINNSQVDDTQKIDIVMPIYNVVANSGAYLKKLGRLWQYYRDEPALNVNDEIIDFPANNNNSASFKFKQWITGKTGNGGKKDAEIMVSLKYVSNFWITIEIRLINCEINL